jgi:hypothetical protein
LNDKSIFYLFSIKGVINSLKSEYLSFFSWYFLSFLGAWVSSMRRLSAVHDSIRLERCMGGR